MVWSRSLGGGTGDEVSRLQLHLVDINVITFKNAGACPGCGKGSGVLVGWLKFNGALNTI